MPTVNFSISGVSAGYTSWTGSFIVTGLNNAIESDSSITKITINPGSDNYEFVPTGSVFTWGALENGVNNDYSTWRTQSIQTQFPTTGKSIDLWSELLYNDIKAGYNWNQITSYSLNATKHSLVYDYDNFYAPYYSRGGIITFSTTA